MSQVDPDPGNPGWSAAHAAVSAEWLIDDEGVRRLAMLRHPTQAFNGAVDAAEGLEAGLRRIAAAYIERVRASCPTEADGAPVLGRAGAWLLAGHRQGFGWLNLGWGLAGVAHTDPSLSFQVQRAWKGFMPSDRTVVLLAANRHGLQRGGTAQRCEGASVGLRVVMHLADNPDPSGQLLVRVTGLSASRLAWARAPGRSVARRLSPRGRRKLTALVEARFGFEAGSTQVTDTLWPDGRALPALLAGSARLAAAGHALVQWTARPLSGRPGGLNLHALRWVDQRSAAHGLGFRQDPASMGPADDGTLRRPSSRDETLNALRRPTLSAAASAASATSAASQPGGAAASASASASALLVLQDTDHPIRFEVRQSRLADSLNDPDQLQSVDPDKLPLRSDHLSAFHAYLRAAELFERLEAYGLEAQQYFKLARLPLVMRHRAAVRGQPDGLAVNAEVRPLGAEPSAYERLDETARPQLELRFGSASLEHRTIGPDDHGQQRAQPLGLAADPRLAWHEFGHVLAYAATGALEFHFAHSAGDALAAVIADPGSALSADAHMRGLTFPWLLLARRHDRPALDGWCWCGQRNGQRRVPFSLPAPLHKGYIEEQLLSSSVFLLYRALGGDSFTQPRRRRTAADYVAYLLMRAIALLGPAAVVPALTPDAFVSALIDADIGTGDWSVWVPAGNQQKHLPRRRIGGTAHKVLRWAFEQQGLYATDDPLALAEGLGRPPAVDLYLPGLSLPGLSDRAAGGYTPVDLKWPPAAGTSPAPWHSDDAGLRFDTERGQLVASVHNRGQQTAVDARCRAWAARVSDSALDWQPLPLIGPGKADVSPQGLVPFRFALQVDKLLLRGRWWLLVEVDGPGDRANLNPAAQLACSAATPPAEPWLLVDLVANDNNLGLRCFDFD